MKTKTINWIKRFPLANGIVIGVAAVAMLAKCVPAFAGLLFTSLTVVNSTSAPTNLPAGGVAIGSFQLGSKNFSIANSGLASTSALSVNFQISADGLNFTNVFTYTPAITNAQTDSFVTPATNITIYGRVQIYATNVGVGVVLN